MNTLKPHNRTYPIRILITLMFLITPCAGSALDASLEGNRDPVDKRKIAAMVNGQPVFEEALSPYVEKEIKKYKKYGVKKDAASLQKHFQKKVLDRLIDQELLVQESRKLKIDNMEEKIAQRMAIKNTPPRAKHVNSVSEKTGPPVMTKEEIIKNIYLDEYLKEHGILEPAIPEAEIKAFYESGKDNFRQDEYIRVSHILIKADEKATPEEKDLARRKAEDIRKEILGGKDFGKTAKEHSQDGMAPKGGDLDYIKRGYMPPEFDAAAFSLGKGDVSGVVQTKFGFHIIKLADRKPGGITPYDELKDFIRTYLQKEMSKKKLASHIEELRAKATIEILLDKSGNDNLQEVRHD